MAQGEGEARGALPTVIVIGAMKCGTSALHRYLDAHPEIAMSDPKELNFFFGPAAGEVPWPRGNWWRGVDWYRRHFPPAVAIRGETSPGYTSPDHPEVAARMAATVPEVRLVYLVRDPLERALSQYRHHRRDGSERRPADQALLDPDSHYLARSRYHARLEPFLAGFPRARILVVAAEDLRRDRRAALSRVYAHVGADEGFWSEALAVEHHTSACSGPALSPRTRDAFRAALRRDVDRLQEVVGRSLPWSL